MDEVQEWGRGLHQLGHASRTKENDKESLRKHWQQSA
jgi:hypothetical protein